MRPLLAVVVIGVAGVLLTQSMVGNAISVVTPRHIATTYRFAAMIMGAYNVETREKRQINPNCIAVVTNYTRNPDFTTCVRMFQSLQNFSSFTHAEVEEFCGHHCPSLVLNAFKAITAACGTGFPGGGVRVLVAEASVVVWSTYYNVGRCSVPEQL